MKKLPEVFRRRSRLAQAGATFLLALGLTSGLWLATSPVAHARLMSPSEMIEAGLPPGIQIKSAGKPQFLTAVCAAVKSHHNSAAAITKLAVGSHRDYAGDIVATTVRCSRGETVDCDLISSIVAAGISAAPESAAVIDDAAVATAPDCVDAVQTRTESDGKQVLDGKEMLGDGKEILDGKEVLSDIPGEGPGDFGSPPANPPPPFGPLGGGGGGFNPDDTLVMVCDNGRQRTIRGSRIDQFLHRHPGAFVGSCQITPATSR